MRSFIFLCDISTEQECLDRTLFGTNAGENVELHYSKLAVGDRVFLYNFELGSLRGPFMALPACVNNLEPKARKKGRRSFPWQVRVDGSMASSVVAWADDFATFIPLVSSRRPVVPSSRRDGDSRRAISRARARIRRLLVRNLQPFADLRPLPACSSPIQESGPGHG